MSPEDINHISKLIALLMIKTNTDSITITEEDTLLLTKKVLLSDDGGAINLRLVEDTTITTVPDTI